MRKLTILGVIGALAFAGCGDDDEPQPTANPVAPQPVDPNQAAQPAGKTVPLT